MYLKLDCISLPMGSYDIKLLAVAYWWYKQSIHGKNPYNCREVKHFCHGFIIYIYIYIYINKIKKS